ncbi:unnamed protein product, partial [Staurois parvus]
GSSGTGLSGSTAGTGSPGIRQWAPGHQALDRLARQRASGHQASGHLARQRAPRHLARQWAPSHQVRQRALSQLARDSEHRIRYRIIWINSGHRVNWPNRIISWISSSCWVEASG